jgi:hypothetical protein
VNLKINLILWSVTATNLALAPDDKEIQTKHKYTAPQGAMLVEASCWGAPSWAHLSVVGKIIVVTVFSSDRVCIYLVL